MIRSRRDVVLAVAAPMVLVGVSFVDPFFSLMKQGLYHVDSVFHLAGGLLTAFAAVAVGRVYTTWWKRIPEPARALIVVCVVASIGVGWELFEFLSDYFLGTTHQPSLADTMKDLVLDSAGAVLLTLVKR